MKQSNLRYGVLCISFFAYDAITSTQQAISPKQIVLVQNKSLREKFIEETANARYAHVPLYAKTTIKNCIQKYPELKNMINLAALIDETRSVASRETIESITREFITILKNSNLNDIDPSDNTIAIMERYLSELESGSILTDLEVDPMSLDEYAKRSINLFKCLTGIALSAGGVLNVSGTNLTTQGVGNTVTITFPGFANVIRVDWFYGDDLAATVSNGLPFQTIGAAITALTNSALATSLNPYVIWVMPGVYNLTAGVTLPQYTSLLGFSEGAGSTVTSGGSIPTTVGTSGVTIQMLGVTANTTLITMNEYSRLENVSLSLTTAGAFTLTGIALSGTQSLTARIKSVNLNISTSSTAAATGVSSTSTGNPGAEISALEDCVIAMQCTSASSTANIVGVLLNAASGNFNITNCSIAATSASTGAQNCYGVYNETAGLTVGINASNIRSSFTAASASGSASCIGVNNLGTCTINSSQIATSLTGSAGGYMVRNASTCTINSSSLTGTVSAGNLTGIIAAVTSAAVTINSSPITINIIGAGASNITVVGAYNNSSNTVTLNESPITISTTTMTAGPIYGLYNAATGTSIVTSSPITITSTAAASTTAVYGINLSSSGPCIISSSAITVTSSTGAATGIYNSGGACTVTACPIVATSGTGTTVFGVQNNATNVTTTVSDSTISGSNTSGGTTADINQTLGNIVLNGTKLVTNSSYGVSTNLGGNFQGFPTSFIEWSAIGALSTSTTRSMIPNGTFTASTTNPTGITILRAPRPLIIKNINADCGTAPGGVTSTTFTLLKNNVSAGLPTSIVGTTTHSAFITGVASFTGGDEITMQISGNSTATANILVSAEVY